jgi:uncharacterized membrane protein YbhN (UPF0104 family)
VTARRLTLAVGAGALALALAFVGFRHFADTAWPLSRGNPGLLAAAGVLFLLGYALKICAWRRLFAVGERPQALALVAATGGALLVGLAVPNRCADVVRIAIVDRYPGCRTGVRPVCLSLVMLGLLEAAAFAPLALAFAIMPGQSTGLRAGLVLLAAAGLGAALLVVVMPRVAATELLARSRLGRWLGPRTTSLRVALGACALVSVSWFVRVFAFLLLLGALGAGFSFTLAVLYLAAGQIAGVLPIAPAGATKAAAGAAALIASDVSASRALDVALAGQALGVLCGVAIVLSVGAWRLTWQRRPVLASGAATL